MILQLILSKIIQSFKPCYKWNAFNTEIEKMKQNAEDLVLNLIISGMPSIRKSLLIKEKKKLSFKPYYKWNAFNTEDKELLVKRLKCFKPYYKWNAFNT